MLVCLWLYADCVGVFASRKSAQACERNLAFRAMVGRERPDFRPISDVRQLPLEAFREVCVQVWRIAGEAGMVPLGHLAPDGTHIQGKASWHNAMRYGYMHPAGDRWRAALAALVPQAYQQDAQDEAARRWLAARATADADAERPRRAAAEAERQRTGPRRRGTAPTPVQEPPDDTAQTNCTDPEVQRRRPNNKG